MPRHLVEGPTVMKAMKGVNKVRQIARENENVELQEPDSDLQPFPFSGLPKLLSHLSFAIAETQRGDEP